MLSARLKLCVPLLLLRPSATRTEKAQPARADVERQTEDTRASRAAVDRQADKTYVPRAAVNRQTGKARVPRAAAEHQTEMTETLRADLLLLLLLHTRRTHLPALTWSARLRRHVPLVLLLTVRLTRLMSLVLL